jgi:hypothetical protein
MKRPCFFLILFVLLGFGVSLAVPGKDVPETAYDESDGLPYEGTRVVSIVVPDTVAQAPAVRPRVSRFRLGSPRAQNLGHVTCWAYSVSASLTILDHSFRC